MTRYNSSIVNEKFWLTDRRNSVLNQLDIETKENILRLEKIYGRICLTPLDIPIIENENFYDWYFQNAKPSIKQRKDIATSDTGSSSFLSLDIVPDHIDLKKTTWTKNVVKNFDKLWPDLWDQFNEYLPFEKIIGVSIWSSRNDIIPHRDATIFLDLPLDFRVLFDNNNKENLYVSEILPDAPPNQFLQTMPVPTQYTTNSFVWNNLRSQHHSRYEENFKKIIFIFQFINPINWTKYEKLIEKSIVKYRSHCLISNHKLGDYVEEIK